MMSEKEIRQQARQYARDFKGSSRARAWWFVNMHMEIIDSVVMDRVRAAYSVNAEYPMTPEEMMAFRKAFVAEIAKMGFLYEGSPGR